MAINRTRIDPEVEFRVGILKRAIERAVNNGYKTEVSIHSLADYAWRGMIKRGLYYNEIYTHQFAIHFFGEGIVPRLDHSEDCASVKKKKCDCGAVETKYKWKKELIKMVLSDDPLLYLQQYMDKKEVK